MDTNNLRRFFGSMLTILGVIVVLFACVAFLSDNNPVLGMRVTKWESAVPFIIGLIFLLTGVNLIRE